MITRNDCISICKKAILDAENYWDKLGMIDGFNQLMRVPKELYALYPDVFDEYYASPKYRICLIDTPNTPSGVRTMV